MGLKKSVKRWCVGFALVATACPLVWAQTAGSGRPFRRDTGRSSGLPQSDIAAVKTLVKQAREDLRKGDLESAETRARAAAAMGAVKYTFYEDSPQKVLTDIAKSREGHNQKQATELLTEARRQVGQNQLDQAELLVAQAEALRPTYTKLYRGDRPDKLRADINKRRKGLGQVRTAMPNRRTTAPSAFAAPRIEPVIYSREIVPIPEQPVPPPVAEHRSLPPVSGLVSPGAPVAETYEQPAPLPTPVITENQPIAAPAVTETAAAAPMPRVPTEKQPLPVAPPAPLPAVEVGEEFPTRSNSANEPPPVEATSQNPHVESPPPAALPSAEVFDPPPLPAVTETPAPPVASLAAQTTGRGNRHPERDRARQLLAQARGHLSRNDYHKALDLAEEVRGMGLSFFKTEDSPDAVVEAIKAQKPDAIAQWQQRKSAPPVVEQKTVDKTAHARVTKQPKSELPPVIRTRYSDQPKPDADPPTQNAEPEHRPPAVEEGLPPEPVPPQPTEHTAAPGHGGVGRPAPNGGIAPRPGVTEVPAEPRVTAGQAAPVQQEPMPPVIESPVQPPPRQYEQPRTIQQEMPPQTPVTEAPPVPQPAPYRQPAMAREPVPQQEMTADMAFELGVRAYRRQEYARAWSHLQNLDLNQLDAAKRTYAQEMLISLKSAGLVQATVPERMQVVDQAPGRAIATDQPPPPVGTPRPALMEEIKARRVIQLQKLKDQRYQTWDKANKLAMQENYDGAIEVLQDALVGLKSFELEPEDMAPLQREYEMRIKRYTGMRDQLATIKVTKPPAPEKENPALRKHLAEEHKKKQVDELLKQYDAFYKEGKYKDAAAIAQKAKEIDPKNPQVEIAIMRADMSRKLKADKQRTDEFEQGVIQAIGDAKESAKSPVSDTKPISYPEGWDRINQRKERNYLPQQGGSPADREIKYKLDKPVSVDFKTKPLGEVLDDLRKQTGINIHADEEAMAKGDIAITRPVTIQLSGVTLKTVLNRMLKSIGLTHYVDEGVLVVTTPDGVKRIDKTYSIADLIVPVENFGAGSVLAALNGKVQQSADPSANTAGTWSSTSSALPGTPGYTPGGAADNKPIQLGRTIHEALIDLITKTIEPSSWDRLGGPGRIEYYPLGHGLFVAQQTPDIQEQIEALLARLRELQDLQVTVEVRFITLQENFFERIGLDFDVEIDDDATRFDNAVANNAFAAPGFINESDHVDNVVIGLTPTGTFTTDLDIPITTTSFERATPPFGGFTPGTPGGTSIGLAFLSDIEVYLFLEAAQGNARSNLLQAPKLTLFNGQLATLNVNTVRRFVTDFDVGINVFGDATLIPRNTEFPEGTTLMLSAVVSADRRYVRLTLMPTLTNIDPTVGTFTVQTPAGPITIQQPVINTISVATTVSVPDGGTVLMGGLKTLNEGRNEFGTPILNKIPYINRLFKNVGYGRDTRSLMIMVTPRIIIPEEEEERLGGTFSM